MDDCSDFFVVDVRMDPTDDTLTSTADTEAAAAAAAAGGDAGALGSELDGEAEESVRRYLGSLDSADLDDRLPTPSRSFDLARIRARDSVVSLGGDVPSGIRVRTLTSSK